MLDDKQIGALKNTIATNNALQKYGNVTFKVAHLYYTISSRPE